LERIDSYVTQHLSSGQSQFVVSVKLLEGGGSRSAADTLVTEAKRLIEGRGLLVTDVKTEEWNYVSNISVQTKAPQPRPARVVAPAAPAQAPIAAAVATQAAAVAQPSNELVTDPWELQDKLAAALQPWATKASAGQPFGPGFNLEQALAAVKSVNADVSAFTAVAGQCADSLIEAVRQGAMTLDHYDALIGIDEAGIARAGLGRNEEQRLIEASEEWKDALIAISTMDSGKLAAWKRADPGGKRTYTYHAVVFGRATARD
jgi:hypothetical protein